MLVSASAKLRHLIAALCTRMRLQRSFSQATMHQYALCRLSNVSQTSRSLVFLSTTCLMQAEQAHREQLPHACSLQPSQQEQLAVLDSKTVLPSRLQCLAAMLQCSLPMQICYSVSAMHSASLLMVLMCNRCASCMRVNAVTQSRIWHDVGPACSVLYVCGSHPTWPPAALSQTHTHSSRCLDRGTVHLHAGGCASPRMCSVSRRCLLDQLRTVRITV